MSEYSNCQGTPAPIAPALPLMTSKSHPIRVDFLSSEIVPLPGRLGMTLAPGKCNVGMHAIWQRDLEQDVQRLRQHYGVEILITLLETPELTKLCIPNLFEQVQSHAIQSHHFPIHDFGIPASTPALLQLVKDILTWVSQSKTVVIHCKAGLGRTGLVTACCLIALGYTPNEAFNQVRQTRPGSVETTEQEQYVSQFVQAWERGGTSPIP